MSIPKRIIQTGRTRDLSLRDQASVTALRHLHPDFSYDFFDDHDIYTFVAQEFPDLLTVWESFTQPIQRVDLFRYLAVYRMGGFYFDLDVLLGHSVHDLLELECVFPFEELSIQPYFCGRLGIDWELGNYAFGARASHPFLKALIDNCVRSRTDRQWVAQTLQGLPRVLHPEFAVLNGTGPGLVTRTWSDAPQTRADATVLFPPDVCDSASWHQFGRYGVHLQAGSWRARGSAWQRRWGRWWEQHRRSVTLREARKRGPTREVYAEAVAVSTPGL